MDLRFYVYQDVSTYLRAWYKGKKNDSPIELGSDLGLTCLVQGEKKRFPHRTRV